MHRPIRKGEVESLRFQIEELTEMWFQNPQKRGIIEFQLMNCTNRLAYIDMINRPLSEKAQ